MVFSTRKKLSHRSFPLAVVRFLLCWYSSQEVHIVLDLSEFLMVFVKEVSTPPYFSLCIWMACCLTMLRVVLGVIGEIFLQVVCVM